MNTLKPCFEKLPIDDSKFADLFGRDRKILAVCMFRGDDTDDRLLSQFNTLTDRFLCEPEYCCEYNPDYDPELLGIFKALGKSGIPVKVGQWVVLTERNRGDGFNLSVYSDKDFRSKYTFSV